MLASDVGFLLFEISERMGKGALWNLFFEPPRTANGADRLSNINAPK